MHAGLIFATRADNAVRLAGVTDAIAPLSITPVIVPIDDARHGMGSYLSQVGPVSYLMAVAITALMLLAGWSYQITHPGRDAINQTVKYDPSAVQPVESVGHITGMKDCRWADPNEWTIVGASVPWGREYALASGLLEITYTSGARVILEGAMPVSGRFHYRRLSCNW